GRRDPPSTARGGGLPLSSRAAGLRKKRGGRRKPGHRGGGWGPPTPAPKPAPPPAAPPNANNARRFIRTRSRGSDLAGAELFGKPIPTFPDHALGSSAVAIAAAPARLRLRLEDVAAEGRRDNENPRIKQMRDTSI